MALGALSSQVLSLHHDIDLNSVDLPHYFGQQIKLQSSAQPFQKTCVMSLYIGDIVKVYSNMRESLSRELIATMTSIKIRLFSQLN